MTARTGGGPDDRSPLRVWSLRLGLLVAATSLVLVAGELFLRQLGAGSGAGDLQDLHVVRPDRPWLYGLRPHVDIEVERFPGVRYRINADGFRGPLGERPKPRDLLRVIVLGDSVAFGIGVAEDDTFPALLASLIAAATTRRSEVLNLGVNGYNAYLESALFTDLGATYEPDLVLVQFCVNDLNDPTLHFEPQTRAHLPPIPDAAYPDPRLRQRATPKAPAWLAACRGLRVCQVADRALFAWRVGQPDADALRAMLEPRSNLSDPVVRTWLARRYGELARNARAAGAGFAVIALPHAGQLTGQGADLQRDLVSLGNEGDWITLDLLPAFIEASRGASAALFDDEWHPNARGHRIAAEATLAGLESFRLLPDAER